MPTITYGEAVDAILTKLGDLDRDLEVQIWSENEIARYFRDGQEILTQKAKMLWDHQMLDTEEGTGTYTLKDSVQEVDRVTYDSEWIQPYTPRQMRDVDALYKTMEGQVYGYLLEEDGLRTIRLVRVPPVDAEDIAVTGTWGTYRTFTDITTGTITGTWGVPRLVEGYHPANSKNGWGVMRRFHQQGLNAKVEHFRRPIRRGLVDDEFQHSPADTFEVPDRYVKYLRWYVLWQALERDGPGQDLEAAEIFMNEWNKCVARAEDRANRVHKARKGVIGGRTNPRRPGPPRPRLPWQYGRIVR